MTIDLPPGLKPGVVLAGTLDTKSAEIGFLQEALQRHGLAVIVIDCGILGTASLDATIGREAVAAAGGGDLVALRRERHRERALDAMLRGLEAVMAALRAKGLVQGYLGVGGGTNAALASVAFRALPFGVPKLLVSTVASGQTRPLVGIKDVVLLHSVVDILGLNGFLRDMLRRAAAMMAALLVETAADAQPDGLAAGRPRIGMTTYGSTNDAAATALELLEGQPVEVLAFHARGVGGEAMESLIREGRIDAVLDLTTTEIADEIVGGINSAGPERLGAAGEAGIAQVVLPGAIDMVNFGPLASVPPAFRERLLARHTPSATLMRTTPEENAAMAAFMAEKLNAARGPVTVVLPLHGFSAYDRKGAPFFDPVADAAFRDGLKARLDPRVTVITVDSHINDHVCMETAVKELLRLTGLAEAGGR